MKIGGYNIHIKQYDNIIDTIKMKYEDFNEKNVYKYRFLKYIGNRKNDDNITEHVLLLWEYILNTVNNIIIASFTDNGVSSLSAILLSESSVDEYTIFENAEITDEIRNIFNKATNERPNIILISYLAKKTVDNVDIEHVFLVVNEGEYITVSLCIIDPKMNTYTEKQIISSEELDIDEYLKSLMNG